MVLIAMIFEMLSIALGQKQCLKRLYHVEASKAHLQLKS